MIFSCAFDPTPAISAKSPIASSSRLLSPSRYTSTVQSAAAPLVVVALAVPGLGVAVGRAAAGLGVAVERAVGGLVVLGGVSSKQLLNPPASSTRARPPPSWRSEISRRR